MRKIDSDLFSIDIKKTRIYSSWTKDISIVDRRDVYISYITRHSHFRYSGRLDQRVSDRSIRQKGSHGGVMRLRNHRNGASGITLYVIGTEFRLKKSGMVADPGDDILRDDIHRSDTSSEHCARRVFPG